MTPASNDSPDPGLHTGVAMRIGRLPLIGRDAELRLLDQVIDAALDGDARIVLLDGDAGIGKSRLLAEIGRRAEAKGAVFATGWSLDEQGAPPFLPWIELLDQIGTALECGSESPLDQLLHRIPESSGHHADVDSAAKRHLAFIRVASWLTECAAGQPLVLAFDDLQWADLSSLRLLRSVAPHLSGAPVLIVGAYRTSEGAAYPALKQTVEDLQRGRAALSIHLAPLTADGTAGIVRGLLGRDEPALAAVLHDRGDGNPFVVEELVRAVADRGEVDRASIQDSVEAMPLPASIANEIHRRADQLDPGHRALIDIAALAGREIEPRLLELAGRSPPDTVSAALERTAALGLTKRVAAGEMRVTDAYAFSHDRVREAMLEAIPPLQRWAYHDRIAGALIELGPGHQRLPWLAAVSHHASKSGNLKRAAAFAADLGDAALAAHAPEAAARAYQEAIQFHNAASHDSASDALVGLHLKLGRALMASGDSRAVEVFGRAEQLLVKTGTRRDLAEVAFLRGLAASRQEEHDRALASFERARDLLAEQPGSETERARILLQMGSVLGTTLARFDEAIAAGQEALSLLERAPRDDWLNAEARLSLGGALTRANRLAEGREVLEIGYRLALRGGDEPLAAELAGALSNHSYWAADLFASAQFARQRWRLARSTGDRFALRHVRTWLALVEVMAGRWDFAAEMLRDAEEDIARLDSPEPRAFLDQVAGWALLYQGRVAEALPRLTAAMERFREVGPTVLPWYLGVYAFAHWRAGNAETSAEVAAEAVVSMRGLPQEMIARAACAAMLGLMAARSGAPDTENWESSLTPYRGQLQWVLVDRVLGELAAARGDYERAKRYLAAAIETAAAGGIHPEGALARAEIAVARLHCQEPGAADAVQQAVDHLQAIGMSVDAERIQARAAAVRADGQPRLPFGITKRETEVLALVAQGLSNHEIGERLSISEKTVINHLTNIFTKAGLENRAAAAAFATRHGLAP